MKTIYLDHYPVPWAAARVGKKGAFNPKGKEKIFTQWMIKNQHREEVLPGFYVLDFLFIFPIPRSASKAQKEKMMRREIIPTCSDCTNLQKFYEDCLKKIVIKDDRYVAKISSEKIYGEKKGIIIKIFTLEEYRKINENYFR